MPLTAADAQRGQATPATALVGIGQQRMLQDEVLDLYRTRSSPARSDIGDVDLTSRTTSPASHQPP